MNWGMIREVGADYSRITKIAAALSNNSKAFILALLNNP
jgi:hypothetical protein